MSDITFDCQHCQGSLTVDERGAGLEVPCPLCGKQVAIPKKKVVVELPPTIASKRKVVRTSEPYEPETKRCPFCAEIVQYAAKKCKHCCEILDPTLRASPETKGAWTGSEMFILFILTLVIPLVGLVAGFVGLFNPKRMSQGVALLVLAAVEITLLWTLM